MSLTNTKKNPYTKHRKSRLSKIQLYINHLRWLAVGVLRSPVLFGLVHEGGERPTNFTSIRLGGPRFNDL